MILSFILLAVTEEFSNKEKQKLQRKTVIPPVDYIPGGNNQQWTRKKEGDYFTLQDNKTEKFLTALNHSTMNISGRFLVIYRSFLVLPHINSFFTLPRSES